MHHILGSLGLQVATFPEGRGGSQTRVSRGGLKWSLTTQTLQLVSMCLYVPPGPPVSPAYLSLKYTMQIPASPVSIETKISHLPQPVPQWKKPTQETPTNEDRQRPEEHFPCAEESGFHSQWSILLSPPVMAGEGMGDTGTCEKMHFLFENWSDLLQSPPWTINNQSSSTQSQSSAHLLPNLCALPPQRSYSRCMRVSVWHHLILLLLAAQHVGS